MADIVTLAQFDFDSTRVEKSLKDLQGYLFDITKQQQEVTRQTRETTKALAEQKSQADRLVQAFKNGSGDYQKLVQDQYKLRAAGKENTQAFKDLEDQKKTLIETFKNSDKQFVNVIQRTAELTKKEKDLFSEGKNLQTQRSVINKEYQNTVAIQKMMIESDGMAITARQAYVKATNQEITSIGEARRNNSELLKIRNELNIADGNNAEVLNNLNAKIDQNNKFIKDNVSALEKRKINIGNYTQSILDAYKELEKQKQALLDNKDALIKAREQTQKGSDAYKLYSQHLDVVNAQIQSISNSMDEARGYTSDFSIQLREAAGNLDIFNGGLLAFIARSQAAGGAGNLVTQSLRQISTAVTGLARAFASFIISPVGILLATLSAIAAVAREWYLYNVEIEKTEKLIRGITKASKDVTADIRVMASAIQETFGTPLQDSVEAAKVLVNEFGITYEEALNQIAQGLIKGQDSNKEYLDSLKEYSTFFAQAGYSLEEFRSIVSAGYDLGIYTDKLPDAIKEFSLSIREQTKATRDALVNAFGESFSNELLKGVENGSIGVNEALKKISDEAKKSNLDIQQQAQLTADLFKGAGEDAGGALKIFQAITKSYEDQTRALTDLEEKTDRLLKAQLEFARAKDEAFGTDSLIDFRKEFEILWLKVKTDFYNAISFSVKQLQFLGTSVIVLYETCKKFFGEIIDIVNNIDFSNPIKSLNAFISANVNAGKSFSNTLKSIYAQKEATESLKLVEEAIGKVTEQNAARREKNAKDAEAARKKQEALEKAAHDAAMKRIDVEIARQREALELWVLQQGDRARTLQEQLELEDSTSKKSIEILEFELKSKKISQEKYDTEVLKLKQKSAKLIAQIAVKSAEIELDNSIQTNKSILENGRLLTQETLKQEMERLKLIADARKSFEKTQYDQGLIDLDEYNKRVRQIDIQYLEDDKSLKKTYTDQQRATDELNRSLQAESDINALKLKLSNEAEVKRVQAEFERNDEIIKLDQQRIDGLISEENYQIALNNIRGRYAITTKQIDEEVLKARLDLTKQVFSGIAEAVGEQTALGKAAGIATASVNTYQGASEVIKSPAVFPEPYNTILKALQVTATIGMGLNTVKNISKVKVPSAPKGYATGGIITDGFGIKRSNGDNVLITAKTGEAILNQQQQSFIGRDLLSLAGVPGFATGGLVGTKPSSLASVQNSIFPQIDFTALTEAVRQGALEGSQQGSLVGSQQGTTVGSQQGISQLSSSRVVQGNSVR
ncbi:phage tail tape measure protein [Paenimyroides ceti]